MCRAGTARINACGIVRLLTTMKQEAPPFMGGVVHVDWVFMSGNGKTKFLMKLGKSIVTLVYLILTLPQMLLNIIEVV